MTTHNVTQDEERLREIVKSVVSAYSTRNLVAIITASFITGGWAAKVQFDLSYAQRVLAEERANTDIRVKEWTNWRNSVSGKVDQTRWIVDNHELRLASLEKK